MCRCPTARSSSWHACPSRSGSFRPFCGRLGREPSGEVLAAAMAKILEMPKLSPTMEEGVLSAWHKKEGDPIAVDDLLAEVETDKATMEFRAFDKGTLLKILVAAGSQVRLGQPVAILGEAGEDVSALAGQTA